MVDISTMDRDSKEEYLKLLRAKNLRLKQAKLDQYYPKTGLLSRFNYPKHMKFFQLGTEYSERCIMAANRIGKALKHGTQVATPYGWKAIEELILGEVVIAADGSLTDVIGIYPQGEKQLYKILFDSDEEVTCCGEHLWKYSSGLRQRQLSSQSQDSQSQDITAKELLTNNFPEVTNTEQLIKFIVAGKVIFVPRVVHLNSSGNCLPITEDYFTQSENYLKNTQQLDSHLIDCQITQINLGETAPCTCIEVSHSEHTFILTGGIVTHNSEGIGAYETTLHLTGRYPDWWEGHRFTRPITCWAAGTTSTTARDIVQLKLIGNPEEFGTGLIPKKHIIKTTPKAGGVPNAVDTILVKHISGGISRCKIKSYAEGRKSFEGTEQDLIWLDEECPMSIYVECVTRTMTTNGLIMLTFTPLEGLTDTVMQFMPDGEVKERQDGSKCLVMATWDDAPHLTKEQKDKLFAALPPHQREARSKGIPQLGSGAIFPIQESNITVADFQIPEHWHRCYALDIGWKKTACLWAATDPTAKITYLYSEYYQGQAEPVIHAEGIKARGLWIPGVIDSAAHGRSQEDGKQMFQIYLDHGLDISNANKSVEAGLYKVWQMLSTNRLKVFSSLVNWFSEFRIYRRDENGKIVKSNDHLMDCVRYLVMSGLDRAVARPYWELEAYEESDIFNEVEANLITGY